MDLLRSLLKESLSTPVLPPVNLQNAGHLEIADLVSKFQALQKANKKLLEDSRKHSKTMKDLANLEVRLLSSLQNSGIVKDGDPLKEVLDGHQCVANFAVRESADLDRLTNETVIEPLKKYQKVFTAVNDRLRIREDQICNILKCAEKLEKLRRQGEASVSNKNWKMAPLAVQKEKMEREFVKTERLLVEELKALFDLRHKYFAPVLQAHALSLVSYYGQQTKMFCDVGGSFRSEFASCPPVSNRDFQEYVNAEMGRLKRLKSCFGAGK